MDRIINMIYHLQVINQCFCVLKQDDEGRRSVQEHRMDTTLYDEEGEDEESDADDFIVDDDGRPITEKKKKVKRSKLSK